MTESHRIQKERTRFERKDSTERRDSDALHENHCARNGRNFLSARPSAVGGAAVSRGKPPRATAAQSGISVASCRFVGAVRTIVKYTRGESKRARSPLSLHRPSRLAVFARPLRRAASNCRRARPRDSPSVRECRRDEGTSSSSIDRPCVLAEEKNRGKENGRAEVGNPSTADVLFIAPSYHRSLSLALSALATSLPPPPSLCLSFSPHSSRALFLTRSHSLFFFLFLPLPLSLCLSFPRSRSFSFSRRSVGRSVGSLVDGRRAAPRRGAASKRASNIERAAPPGDSPRRVYARSCRPRRQKRASASSDSDVCCSSAVPGYRRRFRGRSRRELAARIL